MIISLQGGNALTQELLRRLTQSGTMYLIPAEIHTKCIIRFTVTSQLTTPDDILGDWGIISKMAANLLAEMQPLSDTEEPQAGKAEVGRAPCDLKSETTDTEESQRTNPARDNPDLEPEETENPVFSPEQVHVELWIDKAWNRQRRPIRSLRCNSEPLPCTTFGPLSGYNIETKPDPKDPVAVSSLMDEKPRPLPSSIDKIPEMCPSLLGKQVLKQWVQCGRYHLCCPLRGPQIAPKRFSSSCRRLSCMACSPVANTAPSPAPVETTPVQKIL